MTPKTLTAALALGLAAVAGGAAQAQTSTYLEAVCLEGGRSKAVCACADEKLFALLGADKYADYEALAIERLSNPSANAGEQWTGAVATMAAKRGIDEATIKAQVLPAVEMHRQFMRECR